MGTAAKILRPKPDFSWVPQELRNLTSGTLGGLLYVLVGVFVVALMVVAWHKLTASSGRGAWGRVLGAVLAAALLVSLPRGIAWMNQHINPTPGGITTGAAYTPDRPAVEGGRG